MAWALLAVAALALVGGLGLFLHLRGPGEEPAAGPSPIAPQRSPEAPAPPPSMKGPAAAPAPATPSPPPPSASAAPTPAPSPAAAAATIRPTSAEQTSEAPEAEARPGADAARLERANELFDRGRFAAALSEARAVLRRNPGNAEARTLVEDAEAAVVVEEHIKKARDALRKGDPEKALQEVRAGLVVAPSDGRLLELFKEATR
jgi:hypothetical protein